MRINYTQKQFSSALPYANLVIAHGKKTKSKKILQSAYHWKGFLYAAAEDFNNALENYQQSINYAINNKRKAETYSAIAVLMTSIKEYDKALQYINRAFHAADIKKSYLYTNKADAYAGLGDFDQALSYYDSAYRYIAKNVDENTNAIYRKILLLNRMGKNSEAVTTFSQYKSHLEDDILALESKAMLYVSAGEAYSLLGDYQNAEQYLRKAQELNNHLSLNDQRVLMHKLVRLYYETKKYKTAFDYHLLCHQLDDSIKTNDIILEVNDLETKYRTAEKDKAIAEQNVIITQSKEKRYKDRVLSAGIVAGLVVVLLLLWVRYYYLRQKNQKLQSEQEIGRLQAMMDGEEKERTRMAQELHDGVNSSLAATHSYMQTMEQLYPQMGTAEPFLKVKQLLQSTSSEIRTIAHNLSPYNLIQNGIRYTIQDFCHNLFAGKTRVEVQCFGPIQYLPQSTGLFMYRIAQELLHNIHKHAHATEVIVVLGVKEQEVNLTIEDNGIGIAQPDQKKAGIGLENLKERVRSHHGQVTIDSSPAQGTVVFVSIPLKSLH